MNPSRLSLVALLWSVAVLKGAEAVFNPAVARPVCLDLPTTDTVWQAALTPDSKLLVSSSTGGAGTMTLRRFFLDGRLDSGFQPLTFSSGGLQIGFRVFSNGKIWIPVERTLTQLNADGTIDTAFLSSSWGRIYGMEESPTGERYLAGAGEFGLNLFRVRDDGTRDPSFALTPTSQFVHQFGITSRGEIYAVTTQATGSRASAFVRLRADGTRDETFQPGWIGIIRAIGPDIFGVFDSSQYVPGRWRRFLRSGAIDPTFTPLEYTIISNRSLPVRDEIGRFYSLNRDGESLGGWLRRFDENGVVDPAFPQLDVDNVISRRTFLGLAEGDLFYSVSNADFLNGDDFACANTGRRASVIRISLNPPPQRIVMAQTLELNRAGTMLSESLASAGLNVARTGPNAAPFIARYRTRSGSAAEGVDFVHAEGLLQFDAGIARAQLPVVVLDDNEVEEPEFFWIDFTTETGEALSTLKVWVHSDESVFALDAARKGDDGTWRVPLRGNVETFEMRSFQVGSSPDSAGIETENGSSFIEFAPTEQLKLFAPRFRGWTGAVTADQP